MRIIGTLLLTLNVLAISVTAQKLDHRLGYMLVRLDQDVLPEDVIEEHSNRISGELTIDRQVSKHLGIYLVRFDHSRIHEGHLLNQLNADRKVIAAQYDHLLKQRTEPNDPQFFSQWQWLNTGQTGGLLDADIDADEAWNITQGGVTVNGDTIVVAIVDDGMDYFHEDIAANAWVNYGEIDGNGLDDDGNGYIDDIRGWNAYDNSPEVWGEDHGLNVAGMIGAVGNNNIGIAGVNWHVKMMIIVGGTPESSVIASYSYALDQRKLYNETNGDKGAFVVATNSSWGIDFGQPADAPLWCAFYDTLGVYGILSAGATANRDIDIDAVGDLPTGCPSEYLLSVTALNHNNQRTFSAYGLTQVDFGAPGEDIFTTNRNNGYSTTSGTSFASPVAAGLIALLYSAPCPGFGQLIQSDPSEAAIYIRDLIFQGVEPIAGLEDELRFGGSLNAGNSMELMMSLCSDCPIPFAVETEVLSASEVSLTWNLIDTPQSINARYRPVDASTWDTLFNVTQPLVLTGLSGCTVYEVAFESICADTSTGFQANHQFETLGCCELPGNIQSTSGETSLSISWDAVFAAETYLVQWRPEGTTDWLEEETVNPFTTLSGLEGCTYYETRIKTDCDTTESDFTDITIFRTKGCGNCIDLTYCEASSDDASEEVIDSLIIGPLVNHSGSNGGYVLNESLNPSYQAGETYEVWIRPGFPTGDTFDEKFRIWLDANQDGEFTEEELLLDSLLVEEEPILISSLTIPAGALEGSTRLRVSMAFSNPFFPINQDPCGSVDFGEIEDYCVTILQNPGACPEVDTVFFDGITFTGAFMYWPDVEGSIAYTYRYREVGTEEYEELATVDTFAILEGLEKCKSYEVQLRTVCLFDTAGYQVNYILETDCDVAVKEINPLVHSLQTFPNPFDDYFTVRFNSNETGTHHLTMYSVQGQVLSRKTVFADAGIPSEVRMDELNHCAPGLYFLVVEKDGKSASQKIVRI